MPSEKSAGAIIFRMVPVKSATQGVAVSNQAGQFDGINKMVPHYLLLNYPSGHWEFAKGHIEEKENFEKTIRREVEEETGINNLKIIPGFKEYSKYFFRKIYGLKGEAKKKAPWVFKLVVFYLAETKTEDIKISKEHKGFIWLPFEQAVKKVTYKNAKELLKKAHNYLLQKSQ